MHRQDEAGRQKAQLAAGVHKGGRVGHELAGGHQVVKALFPRLPLRFVAAVSELDIGYGPCDPPKELAGRFDTLAGLILLEVAGLKDSAGVRRELRLIREPRFSGFLLRTHATVLPSMNLADV